MPRWLIRSGAADNDRCYSVIAPTRKEAFAKCARLCRGCEEDNRDLREFRCMMCGGEYYAARVRKRHVKRRISENKREVREWLAAHGYYQDKNGAIRGLPET